MLNAYLMYLIINIIFVTDWLEEMDDDDRMEFEGKYDELLTAWHPCIVGAHTRL